MHQLRTVKEPKQSLATFEETVQLLMKVFMFASAPRSCISNSPLLLQPENRHVKFNVDVKVQNKPAHLFALMHKVISAQPDWETDLAPRILLGLWHPSFLPHAKTHLPYCRRSYIGQSIAFARKYFWDSCDVFSIKFSTLAMADGAKFRKDCKAAGKGVMAWTVNDPEHMVEVRMGYAQMPSWGVWLTVCIHRPSDGGLTLLLRILRRLGLTSGQHCKVLTCGITPTCSSRIDTSQSIMTKLRRNTAGCSTGRRSSSTLPCRSINADGTTVTLRATQARSARSTP